jgi:hypothetical protein
MRGSDPEKRDRAGLWRDCLAGRAAGLRNAHDARLFLIEDLLAVEGDRVKRRLGIGMGGDDFALPAGERHPMDRAGRTPKGMRRIDGERRGQFRRIQRQNGSRETAAERTDFYLAKANPRDRRFVRGVEVQRFPPDHGNSWNLPLRLSGSSLARITTSPCGEDLMA